MHEASTYANAESRPSDILTCLRECAAWARLERGLAPLKYVVHPKTARLLNSIGVPGQESGIMRHDIIVTELIEEGIVRVFRDESVVLPKTELRVEEYERAKGGEVGDAIQR